MIIVETVKKKDSNRIAGYLCSDGVKQEFLPKKAVIELTKRGVIENATIQIWNGTEIVRIKDCMNKSAIKNGKAITGKELVLAFYRCPSGLPLIFKWAENIENKQCLFVGVVRDEAGTRFRLFDGSGVTGMSDVSEAYIMRTAGKTFASFNTNNPIEVMKLQRLAASAR